MKEREPLIAGGLVALLLVLWLGFLVHTSPRFAGSGWGGLLGVSGAVLMLAALAYSPIKRSRSVKAWVTRRTSMRVVLAGHMYLGILGAILGLLHTGHKLVSPLGIALTATMLLVVLSGFVGRHLMRQIVLDVNEKKNLLAELEIAYRQTAGELAAWPEQAARVRSWSGFRGRLAATLLGGFSQAARPDAAARAIALAESMADLEYSIKTHDTIKGWFAGWLWFHIVMSLMLCLLLGLHIWAGLHFGLRWSA